MDEMIYNEKGNCITLVKKSNINNTENEKAGRNVWISHYIQNKHDLR
jgi:hypothetical protein